MGKSRKGLLGSVAGDLNSAIDKFKGRLSNSFDQRIGDGLSDLLTGVTGIRTSNIPEISAERLSTIQANREARQNVLAGKGGNFKGYNGKSTKLQFPKSFPGENGEEAYLTNFIHFRCLPTRSGGFTNMAVNEGQDPLYDIFLYVPEELNDEIKVNYEAKEKGLLESVIAKLMTIGEGTDQGIGDQLGQKMKETFGGDMAKAATGKVTNPMKFQIFQGVDLRSFSYSFALIPKSEADSVIIRDIAYAFKRTALPGIVPDTGNRVYSFPNEWAIRYHGPMKQWMDFPMACVLADVKVENSSTRMSDGAPQAVTISLTFQEIMGLDRKKYDERVAAKTNLTGLKRETSQEGGSIDDILGRTGDDVSFGQRFGKASEYFTGTSNQTRSQKEAGGD